MIKIGSKFLRNILPQGAHYDYEVEARQIALFANYETALSDNWRLSIGARAEKMEYDYDNKMLDGRTDDQGVACRFGCRYSRPGDRNDTFEDISPKIGLSYQLNNNNSLQLRAQRGIRAPQATELYRLQGSQTVADLQMITRVTSGTWSTLEVTSGNFP